MLPVTSLELLVGTDEDTDRLSNRQLSESSSCRSDGQAEDSLPVSFQRVALDDRSVGLVALPSVQVFLNCTMMT